MIKLHLRLGPCEGEDTLEDRRVVVLVGQVESFTARGGDHSPKGDFGRGSRRKADTPPKAEDRVEYRTRGVGERLAVDYRHRRTDPASPSKETRPIGFVLWPIYALAFRNCDVRRPKRPVSRRPLPPRSENSAAVGDKLRLDEQIREGWVSCVSRIGCQHHFRVRGQLD